MKAVYKNEGRMRKMKKLVSVALVVMLIFALATTVKAATPSEDLYAYASKTFTIANTPVKLDSYYLNELESYLNENSITQEQCNAIKAQIDNIVNAMDEAGVSDVYALTGEAEAKVKSYVQAAAAVVNLTVTFNAKTDRPIIYDADGKKITELDPNAGKLLRPTGSTHYEYIAVPAVAIIAVAIVIGYKKVTANA